MAFENGTRTINGKPGPHYWQNHSNYDIDITMAPPNRTIKGSEQITYFNDSPDTLRKIVLSLYMNYHKPEAIHYVSMDSVQFTSGVHIDYFAVNGKKEVWHDPEDHYTWQVVRLPKPLLPGDSVLLSIGWHHEITSIFSDALLFGGSRPGTMNDGMIDSATYAIAYFYPRVAVYDDYNGWNRLEFTGAQEYYNDFNDYTLKVHVPKDYIVWGTGILQNPDEVLQPHYAQMLQKSMTSDSVVHIATPSDLQQKNITVQNSVNTWVWKADNTTDVSLFISNHYNWDAASVVVDSITGRRASVQAAYNDTASDFHQAVTIAQYAMNWYSRNLPGVSYPYPAMTVVQGFAGMEYPMMANDGSSGDNDIMLTNQEENHEIAHTYFPFYVGTNESRYAFMDEGWALALETLMAEAKFGSSVHIRSDVREVLGDLSEEEQVPVFATNLQTGLPYLNNGYVKPALAYLALKDMLGDKLFKKCLQGYIARWHGKHPIPWDFFNAFNDVSGKNLNWFWNNWFFSYGYDDLAVGKVEKTNTGYSVTIKNVGGFAIPFDVKINYKDGSKDSIHYTPIVWKENPEQTMVRIQTKKIIQSLVIDNGIWMDANEKDNVWKDQ